MIVSDMKTPFNRATSNLAPATETEDGVTAANAGSSSILLQGGRVPTVAALCNAEWRMSQQKLPSLTVARRDGKAKQNPERPIDRRFSERKIQRTSRFDLRLNTHLQSVENRFAKLQRCNEKGISSSNPTGAFCPLTSKGGPLTEKPISRGMSAIFGDESVGRVDHMGVAVPLKPLSPFKDISSSGYHYDSKRVPSSGEHLAKSLSPRQGKQITEHGRDVNGLNVTLLDIANLSHKTVAKRERDRESLAQSKPSTEFLFNTFQDIERFRNLLREEEKQEKSRQETSRRVNYCDQEKTKRIEEWLQNVTEIQEREGICTDTVEDSIEDEKVFHVDKISCID